MKMISRMALLLLLMLCMCGRAWAYEHSLLIEPQELADALARGDGIFIDLRPEKAFNRMHIPGFVHLPYDEADVLALAGEDTEIYLICAAGRTSAKAYNLLLDAGAQRVHAAVFGVEEYAEAMGLENMEGADICVPCILLQKSLEQMMREEREITAEEEAFGEEAEIMKEDTKEEGA